MPATLEAPTEANPFANLIPKAATDYGTFSDLVPSGLKTGASVAGQEDFGLFSDLVPKSPTSETEKVVADTPVMSEFDKNFQAAEKFVSTSTGIPFHESMNALRSLSAGAGKYIFEGLQGFELNRAKMLANPPSELTKLQGDEMILPDGSIMSKEQQDALERRYHDAAIAQIPDAKAKADYFKQVAENADTSQYVDPELAKTIPARIAHAAGSAGVMAVESMIPFAGIPFMVMHGAMATEAEAKNAGKTDAEAETAGVRSAIGLALFGGASKLAALGVAKLLPDGASSVRTFLTQFVGQEAANETSSRAINAWESAADAPEGKKIEAALNALKDTTLEQSTLNTVYALAHASKAAERTLVRPEAAPEPSVPLKATEIPPVTTGEPIEQAPAAEVLKAEPQAVSGGTGQMELPKVLYHGSTRGFEEFGPQQSVTGHPSSALGYFMSEYPHQAEIFTKDKTNAGPFTPFTELPYAQGANIRPVTANLQNPKVMSRREFTDLFIDERYHERTAEGFAQIRKQLKKEGYDGIVVEPESNYYKGSGLEEYLGKTVIAFDPKQIKTALKAEPKPQGEPSNAVSESTSMGLGTHAGGDESLGRPGKSERVGSVESTVPQAAEEIAQAQKEPIGVADAIAEIQRRNAPEPSTTGIAQRVHDVRASEGRQGEILPGEGVTAEDMVNRGRDLLNAGADPEKIIAGVSAGNAVTGDQMAVLRARHEQFSNATDQAADALRKTPNNLAAKQIYEDAFKAETDFAQRIKPAATEWHKVGQSMQGETDIQTGTFTGLRRAFHAITGRDVTPKEAVKLDNTATKVQKANSAVEKAKSDFSEVVKTATKNTLPKTAAELRAHFAEKFKAMLPC